MMPKRSNTRRPRKNGRSQGTTIRTPTEAFEYSLARGADSFNLKGKLLFTNTTSTTPALLFSLTPINLTGRPANLAAVFSRFRFNKIGIKFMETTTGVNTVLGILDDSSSAEGDAPASIGGVLEMRCSALAFGAQTVPTFLEWRPVDRSKWYYCTAGVSGSDVRLSVPAVVYAASSAAGGIAGEIDFDITFKGADDTGTS